MKNKSIDITFFTIIDIIYNLCERIKLSLYQTQAEDHQSQAHPQAGGLSWITHKPLHSLWHPNRLYVPQGSEVMSWGSSPTEYEIWHQAQVTRKSFQQQNNGSHFLVQDSTHWNNSQDLKGQLGTMGGGIHMLVEYSLILTGLLTEEDKKEGRSQ